MSLSMDTTTPLTSQTVRSRALRLGLQALVFALTGNYGKKGSGFVGFPWLDHDGLEGFIRGMFSLKDMMHSTALKIIGKTIADNVRWRLAGHSDEMILHETGRDIIASGRLTSGALFWYVHGGLLEASQDVRFLELDALHPPGIAHPCVDHAMAEAVGAAVGRETLS